MSMKGCGGRAAAANLRLGGRGHLRKETLRNASLGLSPNLVTARRLG